MKHFAKFVFMVALAAAHIGNAADTMPLIFRSPESRVLLLELYTSEGCSSCPPAETWLSGAKQAPELWRSFVPVAFHVDYWDYLGWKDGAGSASFSNRQRDYARAWHADTVYTPGFVANGKEWRNWGGDIKRLSPPAAKAGILEISSGDTNHWQIHFTPAAKGPSRYEAHVALLGSGILSDVKAGENRGRRLVHDFSVLSLVKASLALNEGLLSGEAVIPRSPTNSQGQFAIAAWVTLEGRMEPVQTVGGWLHR